MIDRLPYKQIWRTRLGVDEDFALEVNPFRPVTHDDVQYLLDKFQFLRMVNTNAEFAEEITLKLVEANSGWIIHDYGDAMSASSGKFMYGGGDSEAFLRYILAAEGQGEEGGEEGGEGAPMANPGKGTIIKQAYDTAVSMIDLISDRWDGVMLVDGSRLMKWAAWLEAKRKRLLVEGFEPTEEELARRERLEELRGAAAEELRVHPT